MRARNFLQKYVYGLRMKHTDTTLAIGKNAIIGAIEEGICQIHALSGGEGWKVKTEVTFNDMRQSIFDFKSKYPIESVIGIWPGEKQAIKNFLKEEFQKVDIEDGFTCSDIYCPQDLILHRPTFIEVSPGKKIMPGEYKISGGCGNGGKFGNYIEFNPHCIDKCKPCDCGWFLEYYASYNPIMSLDDDIDLPYQYFPVLSYFVGASIAPGLESYAVGQDVNWITLGRDLLNQMKSRRTPTKLSK